jgi:hypothetical protein
VRPVFERDPFSVCWHDGALLVRRGSVAVLVDAPPGTVLGDEAALIQSIVLTSGRMQAIGGLLPVLAELEPHRVADVPLRVHCPLGEERVPSLLAVWSQGWPDRYPVTLDSAFPGGQFEVGSLGFETLPVISGEVRWQQQEVSPQVAVAVRIIAPEATVVWVPAAAPEAGLKRLCAGADLAVVEIGVQEWPRTRERWRLAVTDALKIGDNVGELWIVGDDGSMGLGETQ